MTWTAPGNWGSRPERPRPTIIATVLHPSLPKVCHVGWEFVIDTGADRTLIAPDYQQILGIPDKLLKFEVSPMPTLGGEIKFRYLKDCSLVFTTDENFKPRTIGGLILYFPPKPASLRSNLCRKLFRCRHGDILFGKKPYPCILGRDVLNRLSVGYCQTSNILFVTARHTDYATALESYF